MECRSRYKPGDMFASIDKHHASDPNAPADGARDDVCPVPLEQPHNGSGDAPGHHLPNHAPVGGYGTHVYDRDHLGYDHHASNPNPEHVPGAVEEFSAGDSEHPYFGIADSAGHHAGHPAVGDFADSEGHQVAYDDHVRALLHDGPGGHFISKHKPVGYTDGVQGNGNGTAARAAQRKSSGMSYVMDHSKDRLGYINHASNPNPERVPGAVEEFSADQGPQMQFAVADSAGHHAGHPAVGDFADQQGRKAAYEDHVRGVLGDGPGGHFTSKHQPVGYTASMQGSSRYASTHGRNYQDSISQVMDHGLGRAPTRSAAQLQAAKSRFPFAYSQPDTAGAAM